MASMKAGVLEATRVTLRMMTILTSAQNANITSGATGYDSKAWEVVKYYYDTQLWLPKNLVIVNKQAFDALDKPTQQALLKCAQEAEARGLDRQPDVRRPEVG